MDDKHGEREFHGEGERGKRADHADSAHCCIIDKIIGWTKPAAFR